MILFFIEKSTNIFIVMLVSGKKALKKPEQMLGSGA